MAFPSLNTDTGSCYFGDTSPKAQAKTYLSWLLAQGRTTIALYPRRKSPSAHANIVRDIVPSDFDVVEVDPSDYDSKVYRAQIKEALV